MIQRALMRITAAVSVRWAGMARPISASAAPETSTPGMRASTKLARRATGTPGVTSVTR